MTRKWNTVNDQSNVNYGAGNEVIHHIEVLKSNICDYNDGYILVIVYISVRAAPGTQVDDAENLHLLMSMYNLIEYSSSYSETTGSLWFYSKDEATDFNTDIANADNFKSFKYKTKLLENTVPQLAPNVANEILKNRTIVIPLKYLSIFWRSLKMLLINCKVEWKLEWTKYCVLSSTGADNDNANHNNIIFTIKDTKLYLPVVSLSARENQKLSDLLSKGFGRSVYWNECKTKSENKNTTNEYRYFLESDFVGVNRLFVLVHLKEDDNVKRFKAKRHYLPKGIIKKYYNVIIIGKTFMINPKIQI